jgi:hypothetical protein
MARERWGIRDRWFGDGPEYPFHSKYDPERIVSIYSKERPYAVDFELRSDENGPFVVGVSVRRDWATGYRGEREPLSPREIQRLPLARFMNAALAFAARTPRPDPHDPQYGRPLDPEPGGRIGPADHRLESERWFSLGASDLFYKVVGIPTEGIVAADKVLAPRGRPRRGHSIDFYRQLGKWVDQVTQEGKRPAREIARRYSVSENTAYQWIHRCRDHGFLAQSTRTKPKEKP